MRPLGRPAKPRTTELGSYVEKLRLDRGWTLKELARRAKVPYKTLSKLELGAVPRRDSGVLIKLAREFDIHPDQLLLLAARTPLLRPPTSSPSSPEVRQPKTLEVTETEAHQLDHFLHFLRYMDTVEELGRAPK